MNRLAPNFFLPFSDKGYCGPDEGGVCCNITISIVLVIYMAIKISKKCDYALRAVFELAFRGSCGPVAVQEIAATQGVPGRFLEIILNELRQGGLVVSHRGNTGGYTLADLPQRITVTQVIEAIEGPISVGVPPDPRKYVRGDAALEDLWVQVNKSLTCICQSANLAELVEREKRSRHAAVPDYSI